jgi:hypothetical protein
MTFVTLVGGIGNAKHQSYVHYRNINNTELLAINLDLLYDIPFRKWKLFKSIKEI